MLPTSNRTHPRFLAVIIYLLTRKHQKHGKIPILGTHNRDIGQMQYPHKNEINPSKAHHNTLFLAFERGNYPEKKQADEFLIDPLSFSS